MHVFQIKPSLKAVRIGRIAARGHSQMQRPCEFDLCLHSNGLVYVSYVEIAGTWQLGLFAQRDIQKHEHLCLYQGRLMSKEESARSDSLYLMQARDPSDLRRRVIIDGDPTFQPNPAGCANFATTRHANGEFVDETRRGDEYPRICLRATKFIESGSEIRVDYDRGSRGNPYRTMMLHNGVSPRSMHSDAFLSVLWKPPHNIISAV